MCRSHSLTTTNVAAIYSTVTIKSVAPASVHVARFSPVVGAVRRNRLRKHFTISRHLRLHYRLNCRPICRITTACTRRPLLSLVSLVSRAPNRQRFTRIRGCGRCCRNGRNIKTSRVRNFVRTHVRTRRHRTRRGHHGLMSLARGRRVYLTDRSSTAPRRIRRTLRSKTRVTRFPAALSTTGRTRDRNLRILVNTPGLVLNGSRSNGISTVRLVRRSLISVVSSSCIPRDLLRTVFLVTRRRPLCRTVQLFALGPTGTVNLSDSHNDLRINGQTSFIAIRRSNIIPHFATIHHRNRHVT